jgi:hypothetical protein
MRDREYWETGTNRTFCLSRAHARAIYRISQKWKVAQAKALRIVIEEAAETLEVWKTPTELAETQRKGKS